MRRVIFPMLLVSFAALYAWRISGVLPVEPVTAHLSNLYLTGVALVVVSGPRAFVDGAGTTRALAAALALVVLNLGLEVVVPALGIEDDVNEAMGDVNTSDPLDAVFGLVAVDLVLALLPWRGRRRLSVAPSGPT